MSTDRIDELLALAALGELSDEEARELESEIAADPGLAAEVAADVDDVTPLWTRRRRVALALGAAAGVVGLVAASVVVVHDDAADDPIAVVVEADDAEVRPLTGDLGGDLRAVHSPAEAAVVLEGSGVPTVADGRTLELWLVRDDRATPVGLFRPDDAGRVRVRFDGVDPTGFVLGVTEEPAGGSRQPTEPILATG